MGVEVPEGAPDETAEARDRKKTRVGLGVATLVIVIIAAIVLGVTISKDNKRRKDSASLIDNPTITPDDSMDSIDSLDDAGDVDDVDDSGDAVDTVDGVDDGKDDGNEDTQDDGDDPDPISPEREFYVSGRGPIDVTLPYEDGTHRVYENSEDAEEGFLQLANFIFNNQFLRLQGVSGFENTGWQNFRVVDEEFQFDAPEDLERPSLPSSPVADGDANAGGGAGAPEFDEVGDEADSFGTNQQENFVDRADFVKSDGRYLYASFGDYLLVLTVEGDFIERIAMPEIEVPEEFQNPEFVDNVFVGDEDIAVEPLTSIARPGFYRPKPRIDGILLGTDRIAVVVAGYGDNYYYYGNTEQRIVNNHQATHIRLYDTRTLASGSLTFLGSQTIDGYYNEGYVIDDHAYLITMSSMNFYPFLVEPLDRWNSRFAQLKDEDYFMQAPEVAKNEVGPNFAAKLAEELSVTTGFLPNISEITIPTDGPSGVPDLENLMFPRGPVDSFVQITAFDMRAEPVEVANAEEPVLELSITIEFIPSSWGHVYSNRDVLIVAAQTSRFAPLWRATEQTTILYAYGLSGTRVSPLSSGTVPGYLLNEFSIDFYEGHVRVATTVRNNLFVPEVLFREPVPMDDPILVDPIMVDTITVDEVMGGGSTGSSGGSASSTVGMATEVFDSCPPLEEECNDEGIRQICLDLLSECKGVRVVPGSCPLEYFCVDDPEASESGMGDSMNPNTDPDGMGSGMDEIPRFVRLNDMKAVSDLLEVLGIDSNELVWDDDSVCLPVYGDCNDEWARQQCLNLEDLGCSDIIMNVNCPATYQCTDEEFQPSRTLNRIYVLRVPGPDSDDDSMEIVGDVRLGKPNEVFTAVRFLDEIAYAVTFEQRDPFYVVDLKDPTNPFELGALDVSGFSSYLHPIDRDNQYVIGVGQEADDRGTVLGLQISLFNATDPLDPQLVARHVIENNREEWSSSVVEWDDKAFRYLDLGNISGRLIIPLTVSSRDNYFDGFAVFAINLNGIFPVFRIEHVDDPNKCYYCASVAQRSFVVDGDVITFKGRSVRSTDLDTGVVKWEEDFSWESDQCCTWYY